NEPPLVHYNIPILGHSIEFLNNSQELFRKAHQQVTFLIYNIILSNTEINQTCFCNRFQVYAFGRIITVVTNELSYEILNTTSMNLLAHIEQIVPLAQLFNLHKEDYATIISGLVQEINGRMEELCHDKEIIKTFKNFAGDVSKHLRATPFLSFIHPWLSKQLFIIQFKFGDNAVRNHISLLISRIKPIIGKRLKDQINFGESYQKPNMQHDQLFVGNNADKFELLEKMRRLDSFVKESMRTCSNIGEQIGLPHLTMIPEFKFSNGYQVPEGRGVRVYLDPIYHKKVLQGADATEFNGRRYLEKDSSASQISRDFLMFGLGRHACPGRFLAVNEIKFVSL
ncbi:948_t:CDS:2, partial [Ambispora gerdemannii]